MGTEFLRVASMGVSSFHVRAPQRNAGPVPVRRDMTRAACCVSCTENASRPPARTCERICLALHDRILIYVDVMGCRAMRWHVREWDV